MAGGNWYDHMPPGMTDWDDPHPTKGGLQIGDQHFSWDDYEYVRDLKQKLEKAERESRRLEKENAEFRDKEAERKAKLKKLRPDTDTASHWRWSKGERKHAWLQWDTNLEIFYDTGARLTGKGIVYPENWVFPEGYEPPPRPGE